MATLLWVAGGLVAVLLLVAAVVETAMTVYRGLEPIFRMAAS